MAASQGITCLSHGSFNGNLRYCRFPATSASYLCSSLPFTRGELISLQSTPFADPGVSLLNITPAPQRLLVPERLRRRSNGALGTSACHSAAATPIRSPPRNSGDVFTSLAIAVAIPVVCGMLVSIFNAVNVQWYENLRKPHWNPPSWLFGAVWAVLYAAMGFASWLVWVQGGWDIHGYALSLYVLQLVLNLAWPVLFFGAKQIGLALVDILALWAALFACIRAFGVIDPLAARLLYPYLAWVTFASALSYKYWNLNSA